MPIAVNLFDAEHSTGTTRNSTENKQVITNETAMVGVGGKGGGSERDGDKSNEDISNNADLASNLEVGHNRGVWNTLLIGRGSGIPPLPKGLCIYIS